MLTDRHLRLIAELRARDDRSWMDEALLACLRRLRDGGPTSWEEVEVHDAWAAPDALAVTYGSPWGPDVGLVRRRTSMQGEDPVEAGRLVADFDLADPRALSLPGWTTTRTGSAGGATSRRRTAAAGSPVSLGGWGRRATLPPACGAA